MHVGVQGSGKEWVCERNSQCTPAYVAHAETAVYRLRMQYGTAYSDLPAVQTSSPGNATHRWGRGRGTGLGTTGAGSTTASTGCNCTVNDPSLTTVSMGT
jgi:hypothetical protein